VPVYFRLVFVLLYKFRLNCRSFHLVGNHLAIVIDHYRYLSLSSAVSAKWQNLSKSQTHNKNLIIEHLLVFLFCLLSFGLFIMRLGVLKFLTQLIVTCLYVHDPKIISIYALTQGILALCKGRKYNSHSNIT